MGLTVFVAKSPGWSEGEIYGISKLKVNIPAGVEFVEGDNCDFEKSGEVKAARLITKTGKLMFVGEGKRFDCGMKVPESVLKGAELMPVRFDVYGEFIFVTEKKGVSFTVKGEEAGSAAEQSGGTQV